MSQDWPAKGQEECERNISKRGEMTSQEAASV